MLDSYESVIQCLASSFKETLGFSDDATAILTSASAAELCYAMGVHRKFCGISPRPVMVLDINSYDLDTMGIEHGEDDKLPCILKHIGRPYLFNEGDYNRLTVTTNVVFYDGIHNAYKCYVDVQIGAMPNGGSYVN